MHTRPDWTELFVPHWKLKKSLMKQRRNFLRVTPGIRMEGDASHDQKRIVTPEEARRLGASMIVIGRSVTQAKDPVIGI